MRSGGLAQLVEDELCCSHKAFGHVLVESRSTDTPVMWGQTYR